MKLLSLACFGNLFCSSQEPLVKPFRDLSGKMYGERGTDQFYKLLERTVLDMDTPRETYLAQQCFNLGHLGLDLAIPTHMIMLIEHTKIDKKFSNELAASTIMAGTTHLSRSILLGVDKVYYRDSPHMMAFVAVEKPLSTLGDGSHRDVITDMLLWAGIVCGVNEMHSRLVVHNNIHPGNVVSVLFGSSGAKTGRLRNFTQSFSLSKGFEVAKIRNLNFTGTPYYSLPPEKLRKADGYYRVGYSTDIWSLGMILYKLIYDREAFGHLPVHEREKCVLDRHCQLPRYKLRHRHFAPFERVVEKCLKRSKDSRPELKYVVRKTVEVFKLFQRTVYLPVGMEREWDPEENDHLLYLKKAQKLLEKI